jgi:hypothetical protein
VRIPNRTLLRLFLFFQHRALYPPDISMPSCAGYPRPGVKYEPIGIGEYHVPSQATGVLSDADRLYCRNEGGQQWQQYEYVHGGHLNVIRTRFRCTVYLIELVRTLRSFRFTVLPALQLCPSHMLVFFFDRSDSSDDFPVAF